MTVPYRDFLRLPQFWQDWRVWLGAMVLTCAVFLPAHTPLDGVDWVRMHAFYKSYYRDALLGGRFPLWNPFAGLGRPFLADVETATLYPPNLFYLTGIGTGLFFSLGFHFALVLHGTLQCARRLGCSEGAAWFAALGFAFGAPLIGRLQSGQLQVFCTLCWLPLLIHLACALQDRPERRTVVRFASAFALMFLAGSPPLFWVGTWAVACIGLTRLQNLRAAIALLLGALLGVALMAAQLLPFLELVAEGNRPLRDPAFATAFGQQAGSWASFFRSKPPDAFFYWENNLYLGLPLGLAAVVSIPAWKRRELRPFVLAGSLFALIACGSTTPLLPWLAENAPGWGAFRYPSRYAVLTALVVCLFAAVGMDLLIGRFRSKKWRVAAMSVIALPLINMVDAFRAADERAARYAERPASFQESQLAKLLQQNGHSERGTPPPRVSAPPNIIRENSGMVRGYSTMAALSNPMLSRTWHYLHISADAAPLPLNPIHVSPAVFSAPASRFRGAAVAAHADSDGDFTSQPSTEARAFVTTAVQDAASWKDALQMVKAGHPFRQVALVENPREPSTVLLPTIPPGPPGKAVIQSFAAERITVECDAPSSGLLVIAEPWFPGWTAEVNGTKVPVIPANGWMRGIAVPAGTSKVTLTFRPRAFQEGSLISAAACFIACLLWICPAQPRCKGAVKPATA